MKIVFGRMIAILAIGLAAAAWAYSASAQSADDFMGWYKSFCAANPDTVSFFAFVMGSIASALGLGGIASHSPFIRRLFGAKAATVALLALVLASCSAAQLQQAQADIATGIQAACLDVSAAAALPGANPHLQAFATASCPGAVAAASLVQNSATLQWLGSLQGQLAATAGPKV